MPAKKTWTFASTRAGYNKLWSTIAIKATDRAGAERFARKIIAGRDEYRAVEAAIGVPWFFVGALHMRESSCNFAGVLHNGEHIIGTQRKTKLVPAGRGPFATWHEAAIDALKLKGLHKITDWSVARMGYEAERFNGLGYVGKGVNSSYVWAGSNHEMSGKYIADHVWDPKADDTQIGVMTVLAALGEIDAQIGAFLKAPVEPAAAPTAPVVVPAPPQASIQRPSVWTALWGALRGKDAPAAATPIARERLGLAPNGDPVLYDQQDMLSKKGYTLVGQPDGLLGDKTRDAVRAFRKENDLPAGEAIDAKFAAALLAAGTRPAAKARLDAEPKDLRKMGSSQINLLDHLGLFGKILFGGGVLGAGEASGVLNKATDTLQQAQDVLGTIATIATTTIGVVQWCFAHWWIFAIGGGVYLIFKVATGLLNFVVLYRRGVVVRADQ